MTYEEAIKEIENMLIVAEHDCDGTNQEYEERTLEALTMAYKALQKQVPMFDIVMCKDCKNFNCGFCAEFERVVLSGQHGGVNHKWHKVNENDFCKWGEKK